VQMVTTRRNSDDDVPNFEAMITADVAICLLTMNMTVIFGNVRQPEFVYHGSSPLKPVKLISAMKVRTLISHGCQGFLASVMDTSLESPNIENLSVVVREFADVFPDELPGWYVLKYTYLLPLKTS
ncbi:hypothetical protein Tco_0341908, partial [Tanacetum coccineum]